MLGKAQNYLLAHAGMALFSRAGVGGNHNDGRGRMPTPSGGAARRLLPRRAKIFVALFLCRTNAHLMLRDAYSPYPRWRQKRA